MWPFVGARRGLRKCEAAQRDLDAGDLAGAGRRFSQIATEFVPKAGKSPALAAIASRAIVGLGRVSLADGDPLTASARFREARALVPSSSEAAYWEGCAAGHLGYYSYAESCFGMALKLGSHEPNRVRQQRAYARLRLGRIAEAAQDLQDTAALGGLTGAGPLIAALLRADSGDWADAGRAAATVPGPVAAAVTGFTRHLVGDTRGALAGYQRAIEGGLATDTLLDLQGTAALRAGLSATALSAFTALRSRYPGDHNVAARVHAAARARGSDLVADGDVTQGADLLLSTPGGDRVLLGAAARLVAAGKAVPARRALLTYCKTIPEDPHATHLLAQLAWADGDAAEAARLWSLLPTADPRRELGLALCTAGGQAEDSAPPPGLRLLMAGLRSTDPLDAWLGSQAARLEVALRFRRGGWAALDDDVIAIAAPTAADIGDAVRFLDATRVGGNPVPSQLRQPDAWWDLRGEALYRAGRTAELAKLATSQFTTPWLSVAQAESAIAAGRGVTQDTAAWGPRPQAALTVAYARAGLEAAAAGEWARAATCLALGPRANPEQFPVLAAALADGPVFGLIRGLAGDREAAIAVLGQAARESPSDMRLAHARVLMLLHALSAESANLSDRAARWRECIGACVALLNDRAFLDHWKNRAQERYSTPVPDKTLDAAKADIHKLLADRIGAQSEGDVPLVLLLRRETEAARVNAVTRFPGGPLHVAALGDLRTFSLEAQKSPEMMTLFSRAGLAAVERGAGHPSTAAELALDLRCPACRAAGEDRGGPEDDASAPLMCRADCPHFEQENPAFAAVPVPRAEVAKLGSSLAALALADVARTAVTIQPPDLALAAQSWRRAAQLGVLAGTGDEIREEVVRTVRGRVKALESRKAWDSAIELLDAALEPLTDDTERHEKIARDLARVLNTRACEAVNADDTEDAGIEDAAIKDFTRALKLSPGYQRARSNMCELLSQKAVQQAGRGEFIDARSTLKSAMDEYQAGLVLAPGHSELTKGLKATREIFGIVVEKQGSQEVSKAMKLATSQKLAASRRGLEEAVGIYEAGLKVLPDHPGLAKGLDHANQTLKVVRSAQARNGRVVVVKSGGQ